jgi:ketosteroid isomerase-like protein
MEARETMTLGKGPNSHFYLVVGLALLVMWQQGRNWRAAMSEEQRATLAAIERFNDAFNRHDADGLAEFLTEDTIFEDTSPAPDGRRVDGKSAVVEFWRQWFARNPDARFESEETIVSGDRAVVLWVYRKTRNGQPWHLRGVDVFKVRDGKVAAKLAYVKG